MADSWHIYNTTPALRKLSQGRRRTFKAMLSYAGKACLKMKQSEMKQKPVTHAPDTVCHGSVMSLSSWSAEC